MISSAKMQVSNWWRIEGRLREERKRDWEKGRTSQYPGAAYGMHLERDLRDGSCSTATTSRGAGIFVNNGQSNNGKGPSTPYLSLFASLINSLQMKVTKKGEE
jgi:hypothetical protein